MSHLRLCLDILFRRIPYEEILSGCFSNPQRRCSIEVNPRMFSDLVWTEKAARFTGDEIEIIYLSLLQWIDGSASPRLTTSSSIFNLLVRFGEIVFAEIDMEPECKYRRFLTWNESSRRLGEDIFTTSYLASKDYIARRDRHFFAWKPIIGSNNIRLKQLLKKGLAENHFHLKGSAPHFSISWVSLMNYIVGRHENFERLTGLSRLEPEIIHHFTTEPQDLYTDIKIAAYIRIFLYARLLGVSCYRQDDVLSPSFVHILRKDNRFELDMCLGRIQREIEIFKMEFGKIFDDTVADYAIPRNLLESNYNGNILLAGERRFMYLMFKEIFKGNNEELLAYTELFYAYLVIKAKFRQEIVQVNQRVGFKNFQRYQDRKEFFIEEGSIYKKSLYSMAIQATFRNQPLKSFETRIAPRVPRWELKKYIREVDEYAATDLFTNPHYNRLDRYLEQTRRGIPDQRGANDVHHFYTLHFIKQKEQDRYRDFPDYLEFIPRDYRLRRYVKDEARVLIEMRRNMCWASSRILGIDAASSEIGCRPEVFAQAFRFLKYHRSNERFEHLLDGEPFKTKRLGVTYHVGEDFLELADGLRAIEEAIHFLNLSHGDRLGHALALGVEPYDFYKLKSFRISLPAQDLLDNVTWVLAKIRNYSIEGCHEVISVLVEKYNELFAEIYSSMGRNIIPHTLYYEAWKLRGDAPELYFSGNPRPRRQALNFWQRCGWNTRFPETPSIRDINDVAAIYRNYHFNPQVKTRGREIVEFQVSQKYIQAIRLIQKRIQREVGNRGIAIETNPSSNYLIGTFGRYCKHPITNFFNLGLTVDPEKLNDCPQLFVSINTDDQGVFNTYLEKEFTLMALALENMEDETGNKIHRSAMIYDWLDRIRQMGLEQSFKR
jgi:adenosine deaminase